MKKLLPIILISVLMSGCIKIKNVNEDCIDPQAYPNSVILKTLPNPCKTHDILVTIAELGIILNAVQYTELEEKLNEWIYNISKAQSIAAGNLKSALASFLVRYNHKLGQKLIAVSSILLEFDDSIKFEGDDLKVIIMCMEDIKRQAKMISIVNY